MRETSEFATSASAASRLPTKVADIYPTERLVAVDRFRGLAVFCMIFFQLIANFEGLGFLTKIANHGIGEGVQILPGMNIADIIAPLFIFVIGLTYKVSFEKRRALFGYRAAVKHFALRYLSLIGLGGFLYLCNKVFEGKLSSGVDYTFLAVSCLTVASVLFRFVCCFVRAEKIRNAGSSAVNSCFCALGIMAVMVAVYDFAILQNGIEAAVTYGYWLTLQSIGAAGLIALPFMQLKTEKRLVCTTLLFILFTLYHEMGNEKLVDVIPQGGFWGSFGWASILLFASVFADIYYTGFKYYLIAVAAFAVPAVFSVVLFGHINKGSVSPAFILVSTEICAAGFILFHFFGKLRLPFDFLAVWGKNPIVMFLLEFFVVGLYVGAMPDSAVKNAPVYLAVIQVVLMTALLTLIARWLSKNDKFLKL